MVSNDGLEEESYAVTQRTKLKRMPARGAYDKKTVHAILDEGFLCHLGYTIDGQPYVLPNAYGRVGERLYFHGSITNRSFKTLQAGADVCLTVTLLDGLVLARSGFHHSANSRSVVVLGKAEVVTDPEEKHKALDAIVNHIIPGRADDLAEKRPPTKAEYNATIVLSLPLDEVSAKERVGGPKDEEKDMDLNIWAGVLNMHTHVTAGIESAADLKPGLPVPDYVTHYRRPSERHKGGLASTSGSGGMHNASLTPQHLMLAVAVAVLGTICMMTVFQ
ncbi:hypothetical protein WJX73_004622 [Symbiochloris irregularis]|uniref:Flavin-nucleotide-binding protein n=1 Tax=Symbiochloris irregularis TaxID=706552 RepID=A0AAW1PWW9_9CHLO